MSKQAELHWGKFKIPESGKKQTHKYARKLIEMKNTSTTQSK